MIKIVYGLIIGLMCFFIVLRVDRIFRLSLHQGIRYLRNAFFFYGLAFIFRYLIGGLIVYGYLNSVFYIWTKIFFEFFLVMAGFCLLYSLLWKKLDSDEKYSSSLFNFKMAIFYLIALMVVVLDFIWNSFYFLFFSQILLFLFMTGISFSNYVQKKRNGKFLKYYFVAMILSFVVWILNAIASIYLNWNPMILISIYLLNSIIFLLFLFGVVIVTRRN